MRKCLRGLSPARHEPFFSKCQSCTSAPGHIVGDSRVASIVEEGFGSTIVEEGRTHISRVVLIGSMAVSLALMQTPFGLVVEKFVAELLELLELDDHPCAN